MRRKARHCGLATRHRCLLQKNDSRRYAKRRLSNAEQVVCAQLIIVVYGSVFGILVISVIGVVFDHIKARNAQPNYHIHTGNAYQDVQKSFEPGHAECYPSHTVEAENTNRQPVKRAYYRKNQRNNRKNIESLFQIAFPPC